MTIRFDLTGTNRKALVKAISDITGAEAHYLFTPTYAYEIDYFTVTRDGALELDDRADSEEIETLLEELDRMGFHAEPVGEQDGEKAPTEELPLQGESAAQGKSVGLTVSVPLDKVQVGNLTHLLDAKGSLIQKALCIPATPIEITEEAVSFPWFAETPDADTVQAYTHFISALCEMSVNQKRITAREKPVDNEKYAFRCFLLRLGFIGSEYKTERKILLKNLTGSSAFKCGAKKEAADDAVSE